MTFDYPGYELHFIHKQPCNDSSDHLFTLVYKFYSPQTKYQYILHADYHVGDVFAIKFYARPHRFSKHRYAMITNRGDVGNILITCAKCIPLLLKEYPTSSFCFAASSTIDPETNTVEHFGSNQRFKTYKYIAEKKFGTKTFAHYAYDKISAYLLVNKHCGDVEGKEREIVSVLANTYNTLLDVF